MLYLMHSMVDGKISSKSLLQDPANGFASEISRFISDYSKVKPANLKHSDIKVLAWYADTLTITKRNLDIFYDTFISLDFFFIYVSNNVKVAIKVIYYSLDIRV